MILKIFNDTKNVYNKTLGKKDTKRICTIIHILERKYTPLTTFHLTNKMYPHIQQKKPKSPECKE